MTKRRSRVHEKGHKKVEAKKTKPSSPVGDIWAAERKALADGRVPGKRGRPRKVHAPPPPELVQAVSNAEDADGLARSLKAIALASLKGSDEVGYLSPKVAKVLLDIAKESRQVQMRLKAKEGANAIVAGAFEILTKQEREVVEAYRASKRVEPLKPGETPPPPPADEPTKEESHG